MSELKTLIESHGPGGFYKKVCSLLNEGRLSVEDFSYRELAEACGVLPSLGRLREPLVEEDADALLAESNPGVGTNLFKVVTGELVGRKVIEGYEDDAGFVGDKLVSVMPSRGRGQKLAGFRALAGPSEVAEGHAYEESSFGEKFVTTEEAKKGRILSINEELIAFDQTGEINRRAMALGYALRQERERTIVRAVTDADAATKPVYRPGGGGTPLYAEDGSQRNCLGGANTTSPDYASPLPLEGYRSVETALAYRATEVLDDRIDGTPRPVMAPARQMLVPERLRGTALSIVNATEVGVVTAAGEARMANPHRDIEVLSSPFIDEQGVDADWYLGTFARQFVWTEIWPVQTFLQQSDSPAAFERDVVLRVKARYFGGVSAVDTAYVTKVIGA